MVSSGFPESFRAVLRTRSYRLRSATMHPQTVLAQLLGGNFCPRRSITTGLCLARSRSSVGVFQL